MGNTGSTGGHGSHPARSQWGYEDAGKVHLPLSGTLPEMLSDLDLQSRTYGVVDCGSQFRGEGLWTDYVREICRRTDAILTYAF
jgi:hypothetical protein